MGVVSVQSSTVLVTHVLITQALDLKAVSAIGKGSIFVSRCCFPFLLTSNKLFIMCPVFSELCNVMEIIVISIVMRCIMVHWGKKKTQTKTKKTICLTSKHPPFINGATLGRLCLWASVYSPSIKIYSWKDPLYQ